MNRLSICRSLSGVRPMTLRPGTRCSSPTALPSVDSTTLAGTRGARSPELAVRRLAWRAAMALARAANSTHCNSPTAADISHDLGKSVLGEDLAATGAGHVEAMQDVGAQVFARQRAQVEAQAHALRELHQLGHVERLVELGLAREDDAQH